MTDEADDKSLMLRYQESGDVAAFESLFRRNKDSLFRFLLRLSGNETVAEEVSQHSWLRVIEVAESGRFDARSNASFRTWLCTLARNRYVDEHVRRFEASRTESLESYEPDEIGGATEAGDLLEQLERLQTGERLRAAVGALPVEQREVITLWLQGFDLQEVARMTAASSHTVVSRRKYALRKLASALSGMQEER